MSYSFTQIPRDFHGITALFLAVLIFVSASDVTLAASIEDEPKPYSKCWTIDTIADLSTSGAADKSSIYFFAADGALEAIDQKTGARLWSTDLGGSVTSNLLLTDSAAIFVTSGGQVEKAKS